MRPNGIPCLTRVIVLVLLFGAGFLPLVVIAQEATPASQPILSGGREEAWAEILTAFPMEEPQQRGGQVIQATADISTLNGFFAVDSASYTVTDRVYDSLVEISPTDGQPVPELADWWELAPDGVTYTFHLDPDARWHDGTDLTAADVVFSFEAALDPETGFAGQPDLAAAVTSNRAVDDDTVEMTSNGVSADFLWVIRYVVILPKHLWEDVPRAAWVSDPGSTGEDLSRVVGTGPFTLAEWVPGDHARLRRNDAYYGDVPIIDEFVVAVYADDAASIEALKAGEIDIIELIPAARVAEIAATEGLAVAPSDTSGLVYYMPNLDPAKTTLFQDRLVREALFVALDRAALVDAVFLGYGDVGHGTHPPLSPAYAPEQIEPAYDYDPARARQLLAEAGWTDTDGDGVVDKDGQAFAFELLFPDPSPAAPQIVTYVQEAWRAIGVAVTPKAAPWPAAVEAMFETHDFEMVLGGIFSEASGSQGFIFRCDSYEGGGNSVKYCNPRYDELDEQQRRELDPAKRRELQIELANIVWQDLPIGVLAFFDDTTGYSTRLHNLFPTGWGGAGWSLPWVWIDE